jgi:outer membrane immunogenic protein
MRLLLGGLAALAISTNAWSADLLRGSAPAFQEARQYPWAGIYFGAQTGIAHADFEFDGATRPLFEYLLRSTTLEREAAASQNASLENGSGRGGSYGGFIGYNSQWGDVVLGAELNYNRVSISAESSDEIGRIITLGSTTYDYLLTSTATGKLTDYGTLRFRAGYAYNWIMPYAMVGLAAGRADIARTARVDLIQTPSSGIPVSITLAESKAKTGAIGIGYMAGLGVDIGLMPGIFLRAEYEFVQLARIEDVPIRINTGRVAVGVKF